MCFELAFALAARRAEIVTLGPQHEQPPTPKAPYGKLFVGDIVYRHACKLGCEGIVSKQRGSPYRSVRVKHWLKVKNPAAPAVRREAEEEWRSVRRAARRARS